MLVDQVRRQVHTDKNHLETAHKKAEGQQPEAGVGAGLFQRFAQGLLAHRDRQRPVLEHGDQRQDQRHHQAQRQQGGRPAEPANQAQGAGHHGELAERAGGAGNAHGHAAFFRRYGAANHAENHRERGAGQANANQQACAQRQRPGGVGHAHQHQADGVQHPADKHRLGRAETVGQGPGKWLRQAPDQILQGDGKGKGFTPPTEFAAHRRQEQAKAMPYAQGQRQDQRTP